jgi:hypothetical protein
MGTLEGRIVVVGPAVVGSAVGEHNPGPMVSKATLGGGWLAMTRQHGVTRLSWSSAHRGIHAGMGVSAARSITGMATLGSSGMSLLDSLELGCGWVMKN